MENNTVNSEKTVTALVQLQKNPHPTLMKIFKKYGFQLANLLLRGLWQKFIFPEQILRYYSGQELNLDHRLEDIGKFCHELKIPVIPDEQAYEMLDSNLAIREVWIVESKLKTVLEEAIVYSMYVEKLDLNEIKFLKMLSKETRIEIKKWLNLIEESGKESLLLDNALWNIQNIYGHEKEFETNLDLVTNIVQFYIWQVAKNDVGVPIDEYEIISDVQFAIQETKRSGKVPTPEKIARDIKFQHNRAWPQKSKEKVVRRIMWYSILTDQED
ncbi:hypothetical protein D4R87_01125 [bacterium]|nr:MAG: hypothetical protein D4R87_01125 [bacterium]